ncbi:hypothetical protein VZ94_13190 [Methylocucumis oryzae]|uniref:DUF6916 domain-containing protein n=1 Tax=Methylocucumis oryzae TaxID=1632867 RepID=A0A0F3IH89_9GAMM|nr:hypothetical protein VZ94_13190 [Methylocucumis oryzae]
MLNAAAIGYAGQSTASAQAFLLPARPNLSLNGVLNSEIFQALLGETFTLVSLAEPVNEYKAQLKTVTEANSIYMCPKINQFSLVFQMDGKPMLTSGNYVVQHATAGTTQLYLQTTNDKNSSSCRADFNLLI